MREEVCIMELQSLMDRYGEKFILKRIAELVGRPKLERARTEFFLEKALITFNAPNLLM
ncbi:MAG: hypothetical protein JXR89_06555 [Deltaproteobacteria bacterium]|nr:hypothetical protein [Deltaproteobacteria bacterium]